MEYRIPGIDKLGLFKPLHAYVRDLGNGGQPTKP